ncbi:glycosyltransferase family 2 protein [Flaviflagellibacter deserti]|uniref:Glycosyltransferase family 2 protein n=1 Tax=Flaviflagellibacter deserti TaxID=2267266 RepID=A0ABV9Z0T4_9HYPH
MQPSDFNLVSVIIPARNEAENLDFLIEEIAGALSGRAYEIVVVDEASTDDTPGLLARKARAGLPVRHIRHERGMGQSGAIRTGVIHARGSIFVTIDGDGQNNPSYIPALVTTLEGASADVGMVAGQRRGRTDGTLKKYASRFANNLRRSLLNDDNEDSGCGLKAVRADIFRILPYFDGWHRFMPALITREGYKILRLDVVDRPRRFGRSNYGILDRGLRGVLDLFGVWWLMKRFRGRAVATEIETK